MLFWNIFLQNAYWNLIEYTDNRQDLRENITLILPFDGCIIIEFIDPKTMFSTITIIIISLWMVYKVWNVDESFFIESPQVGKVHQSAPKKLIKED